MGVSSSGNQSMSGSFLGSLINLAPLPMGSALRSQSSAGSLSLMSLTFTLLGSPVLLLVILAVHLLGKATIQKPGSHLRSSLSFTGLL